MEAKEATDYKLVCAALHEGKTIEQVKAFPSSHPARQLSSVWSRLSLLAEDRPSATVVLVDGDKIYPPVSARSEILRRLHLDHSGVVKARRKASSRFYWPGLSEAVAQQCRECHACRETERAAPADPPLLPSRVQASYPCLLYTSPSPRDLSTSRMPSSA